MIEVITKSQALVVFDSSSNDGEPVPLFTPPTFTKPGYRLLDRWFEAVNIIATNFIQRLETVPFPQFTLEMDDSERNKLLLDLQWKSPRIHLDQFIDVGSGNQLLEVFSLLSPKPYPYAKITVPNISLGNNGSVLFAIKSVGYGILTGTDKVLVNAEIVSHTYAEKISEGKVITNSITDTASILIPENANRIGFTVFNSTSNIIYIDIANTVSITNYLTRIPPNTLYESSAIITGDIYAIHGESGTISVQVREFT